MQRTERMLAESSLLALNGVDMGTAAFAGGPFGGVQVGAFVRLKPCREPPRFTAPSTSTQQASAGEN